MEQDFRKTAGLSTLYNYLGKIAEGASLFLTAILLARTLPTADFGAYHLLSELLKTAVFLGGLGIPAVFSRYFPEFVEKNNHGGLPRLLLTGLALNLVGLVGLGALFIWITPWLTTVLQMPDLPRYALLFAGCLLTYGFIFTCTYGTQALLLQKSANGVAALCAAVRLGLLFVALSHKPDLFAVLTAILIANAIQGALLVVILLRHTLHHWRKPFQTAIGRRIFRYGIYATMSDSTGFLLELTTDVIIISVVLGSGAVAQYAFAATTVALLMNWLPMRIAGPLLLPLLVRTVERAPAEDKSKETAYLFALVVKAVAFLSLPACAGLFVLARPVINLIFSPQYAPSLNVFLIFAAFAGITEIFAVATLVAQSEERTDLIFQSRIFTIYNLLMNLLLIHPFGITGVAVATSTAVFGKDIYIYWRLRRQMALPLPVKSICKIAAACGLMAAGLFLAVHFIPVTNLFLLFTYIIAAAGFYFVICKFLNLFSPRDRDILQGVLHLKYFPF